MAMAESVDRQDQEALIKAIDTEWQARWAEIIKALKIEDTGQSPMEAIAMLQEIRDIHIQHEKEWERVHGALIYKFEALRDANNAMRETLHKLIIEIDGTIANPFWNVTTRIGERLLDSISRRCRQVLADTRDSLTLTSNS